MSKTIWITPETMDITVNGALLSDLLDGDERVETLAGKIFHMSTDGTSSTGEMVSVLMIEPSDRVRWKPHSPVRTVAYVMWVLGAIAVGTDDNLRWYFEASNDGWPTVERVIEESC